MVEAEAAGCFLSIESSLACSFVSFLVFVRDAADVRDCSGMEAAYYRAGWE